MATNDIKLVTGATQISFADHAGDFSPAAANVLESGTPTDVQISLASVADGAARQSAKFDFGATRAEEYTVLAALEFAATPTAGEVIELYLAPSTNSTAANGNPGGVSGSDGAYSGYSSNLADSVKELMLIGLFVNTAQATGTVQKAVCGRFRPPTRYGTLVVKNESGASLHSDDVEMNVVFDPVVSQIQAAV